MPRQVAIHSHAEGLRTRPRAPPASSEVVRFPSRAVAAATRGLPSRGAENEDPQTTWGCLVPSSAFERTSTAHLSRGLDRRGTTVHAAEATRGHRFGAPVLSQGAGFTGSPRATEQERLGKRANSGGAQPRRSRCAIAGRCATSKLGVSRMRFSTIPRWGVLFPRCHALSPREFAVRPSRLAGLPRSFLCPKERLACSEERSCRCA